MSFETLKIKMQAETIVGLLGAEYPDLKCSVEPDLDTCGQTYFVWILSDPGVQPDLKEFLGRHQFDTWAVSKWSNLDQRGEFCCITFVDVDN